ncbi:piggyBac transposable element-derived protein 4-like [Anthonomus grandis grandis]|uniref:piggyBac transposable element-derived protein 4-like n=1 Tax=Anthonomus grandis grandis TaxID=2921223 RepID=UPI0021650F4C|nr:piggyBac transposable element-derived protein 4-like [Anthonomus grandis grandis]
MVTRRERMKVDKLAAISEIYNEFVENSMICYTPSEFLTVDEMLVPFRGRCGFRMYMPVKPAKYGLKIQILADSKSHYMINSEIYTGKRSDRSNLSIPTETVLRLVGPVVGTNRNITGDNWYTSMELTGELLNRKLTYVGTVKKNKRFVPPEFLPCKKGEVESSIFGFTSTHTIVSHVPKKNKSVILLSTMHNDNVVDDSSKKPDIVLFYNDTKAGVDALDQKCATYSTSRRTRRWSMVIFHMILNVSAINSRVIYQFAAEGK